MQEKFLLLEVKIGDKVSKGSVLAVIESEEIKTSTEPIKPIKEESKTSNIKKGGNFTRNRENY